MSASGPASSTSCAFLFERGISIPKKKSSLGLYMAEIEAGVAPEGIASLVRSLLLDMWRDWQRLDERIGETEAIIAQACRNDERMKQLMTVPGIGPLTASALVAAIGDGSAFAKGRDLSAWLGLVPRQSSTGGRTRLLGISKRGNVHLRKLFIHGARSVLRTSPAPLQPWLEGLRGRMHVNKVVALDQPAILRLDGCTRALRRGQQAPAQRHRRRRRGRRQRWSPARGLPWQSAHEGERLVHEPLRLSVLIEAPRDAITDFLERHPEVRALFDSRWLHLFALDEKGRMAWRYAGNLTWDEAEVEFPRLQAHA